MKNWKKISLTDKEKESYPYKTICHTCKKKFDDVYHHHMINIRQNIRDQCYDTYKKRGVAHSLCEIPAALHNYQFIIRELTEEIQNSLSA